MIQRLVNYRIQERFRPENEFNDRPRARLPGHEERLAALEAYYAKMLDGYDMHQFCSTNNSYKHAVECTTTGIVYESATVASRDTGKPLPSIYYALRNKRPTGGLCFRWKDKKPY